ncbi:MAG: hypothetical protein ACXW1E_08880, partial [Halobacteriota archaeon]
KMSRQIIKNLETSLFILFMIVFFSLSTLHVFSGYADNWDFLRSVSFLFEKPYGFSTMSPPAESEEWKQRYYTEWHDKWIFLPNWPDGAKLLTYSSYKTYLLMQATISIYLTGDSSYYSIIVGSIASRAIVLATFFALLLRFRTRLSCLAFWLFAVISAVVLLDAGWIAFLNSFYEEQIAIIFLPLAALLLIMYYESKSTKIVVLLLICVAYIGSAKTAYFYLPALLGVFIASTLRGKSYIAKFSCFLIVCQTVAFLPVYSGKHESINSYHALYFGALKVIKEYGQDNVRFIGKKPVVQECVGVPVADLAGVQCMNRADASYSDVARLLLSHPLTASKMVLGVLSEGREIRVKYLSKNLSRSPNFSEISLFNLTPIIFHYGGNVVVLFLSLLSVLLLCTSFLKTSRSTSNIIMLKVGLFISCFGFFQYAIALGDGFYEITKHLVVGNYALALSLAFLVPALLTIVLHGFQIEGRFSSSNERILLSELVRTTR